MNDKPAELQRYSGHFHWPDAHGGWVSYQYAMNEIEPLRQRVRELERELEAAVEHLKNIMELFEWGNALKSEDRKKRDAAYAWLAAWEERQR